MKDADIDRIEPLLVTFCSLYSISLVPLHDDEFFRGPPYTAFPINEVSEMVQTLQNICMGIVRFVYPEKQIAHQAVAMYNDHEELTDRNLRLQKQTESARRKATKFFFVFKVNLTMRLRQ